MLRIEESVLIIIDVQGKLASSVYAHEQVCDNIERAIRMAEVFNLPILWTEQAPDKIGPTIDKINNVLFPMIKPMIKRSFSCWDCPEFVQALNKLNRSQMIIAGIETHVCVYQTARDLKTHGYEVHVLADAVSSRVESNKNIAIARMQSEGMIINSVEMSMCELLKTSTHPKFKGIMSQFKRS